LNLYNYKLCNLKISKHLELVGHILNI
jgi:hypothetical protein